MNGTKYGICMKALIVCIAAILTVVLSTNGVYADADVRHGGYRSVDVDINFISGARKYSTQALESKYNSLDKGWFPEYVIDKDQGDTGLCWAFATTSAADISYAKETGNESAIQTSPAHFGYFFYNRVNDPLSNTPSDKNLSVGKYDWRNEGGNNIFSIQAMANRTGLARETLAPFSSSLSKTNAFPASYGNNLCKYAENAIYVDKNTSNYSNVIKSLIKQYGAVATSIYWDDDYYSSAPGFNSYYNNEEATSNHAITIIGWDDDFDSFGTWFGLGDKPDNPGAWIILNSWGSDWGDTLGIGGTGNNTCKVSYEDVSINNEGVCAYDMKEANSNDRFFQHDGNANNSYERITSGGVAANVFTVPSNEDILLNSVGFTEWNEGSINYTVSIYKDLTSNAQPDSGTLLGSQTVRTEHSGYYSFKLSSPVFIEGGHKYSICVSPKSASYFGTEKSGSSSWIKFEAGIDNGESFEKYTSSSSWRDAQSYSYCYRIKGDARAACKVDFDNGAYGTKPDSQVVEKGSTITNPGDLQAEGCTFGGWYTEPECRNKFDFSSVVTKSLTLYAKWTTVPIAGISLSKTSLSIYTGESQTLTATITPSDTPDDKTITWSSSNTDVATVDENGKITGVSAGTATITAKTSNGKTATCTVTVACRITFEMEGGKTPTGGYVRIWRNLALNAGSGSYSLGAEYTPARGGYTFGGFYTGKNGTGTKYFDAEGNLCRTWDKTTATTLYASWIPDTYTITYILNGGTATNPTSYSIISDDIILNNPTREDYEFVGWSGTGLTGTGNKNVKIPKGSTGDRSYTANWSRQIQKYAGSDLDVYLDQEYYNRLPVAVRKAIIPQTIDQPAYGWDGDEAIADTTLRTTDYENVCNFTGALECRYLNKDIRKTQDVGIRRVYALDVQDIYDYYGGKSVTAKQLNRLFWNTDSAVNGICWLRSASTHNSLGAWSIGGRYGSFNDNIVDEHHEARAAFTINTRAAGVDVRIIQRGM